MPAIDFCAHLTQGLNPGDQPFQAPCDHTRYYRRHEIIFREGEAAASLHFIVSGSVKVFKSGLHRHEQILRIAGRGEFVGYRSLFAGEPHSSSAEAREATQLCRLDRGHFEALLKSQPDFALSLIQRLSRELGEMSLELLNRQDASAEERLYHCLARYLAKSKAAPWSPLKRVELANLIGVAPETVSRLMAVLAEKKLIHLEGQDIEIIQP